MENTNVDEEIGLQNDINNNSLIEDEITEAVSEPPQKTLEKVLALQAEEDEEEKALPANVDPNAKKTIRPFVRPNVIFAPRKVV